MSRCDFSTHRECSCEPSGVPCRTQPVIDILSDASTKTATHGTALFIVLAVITLTIIFGFAAQVAPAAI
jgi:hypothetical protein